MTLSLSGPANGLGELATSLVLAYRTQAERRTLAVTVFRQTRALAVEPFTADGLRELAVWSTQGRGLS